MPVVHVIGLLVWFTFIGNFVIELKTGLTDLVHDDVTRPKGSMVVAVRLKSKMAAGSTSSG